VKRFSPDGTLLFCVGKGISGFKDGSSQTATFNFPTYIAVTNNRDLIVVDNGNRAIRKITSDGTVSTIVDGSKSTIKIHYPKHLVVDDNDNIFVADYDDHSIKQITMDGIVTNYIQSSEWNNPFGIVLHQGVMYFSDYNGHCIYKIWNELWNTANHITFPQAIKQQIKCIMILSLKKKNNYPYHSQTWFYCLPKDLLYLIFQYL